MLNAAAAAILSSAVRRVADTGEAGPLTTALIGSGASLILTRGRRPLGVVLLATGGYLLWRKGRGRIRPIMRP